MICNVAGRVRMESESSSEKALEALVLLTREDEGHFVEDDVVESVWIVITKDCHDGSHVVQVHVGH